MQSGMRKRALSSCIPCYKNKKNCNRLHPCNHCAQRRMPKDCTYLSEVSQTLHSDDQLDGDTLVNHVFQSQEATDSREALVQLAEASKRTDAALSQTNDSLAEVYGYVEYSQSNTMALLRRFGLAEDGLQDKSCKIPVEAYVEIEQNMGRLPRREVLDFLIQYYLNEVHWMEQVVYAQWFLGQYQNWWNLGRLTQVIDAEFAVLFLRICAYAAQFLPSPSVTIDSIRGVSLSDIRNACQDVAGKLSAICEKLDGRGNLVRVQHLSVSALYWQCEGQSNAYWEAINNASRVAQKIGLHRGRMRVMPGMQEYDREVRCRMYCSLYLWDSLLSKQMGCNPFLAANLTPEHLPRMCPSSTVGDAPDPYAERLMQILLAKFWRELDSGDRAAGYDIMMAEEHYGEFCTEFLPQLLPVFALNPDNEWHERLPKLQLQRQLLHVAIFSSLCHNFRPVLLMEPDDVRKLAPYKKVLVASHKRSLATAALKMLESVSKLHTLLGRSHTRHVAVILPTFEAAVILVSLIMDGPFPYSEMFDREQAQRLDMDPLTSERAYVTRDRCMRNIRDALVRLELLAEVSNMARTNAVVLRHLIAKIPRGNGLQGPLLRPAS